MRQSENGRHSLSHKRPASLAKFWFGACYYPEHWDAATRADDAIRMTQAGINVVRMAEFVWDMLEPEEGVYRFGLLDETIATLGAQGISTILCTPTATPPRWLTDAHPEVLRVNAENVPQQHGSRQHCCHANPRFRAYSQNITRTMAGHFAENPHVVGWQTDNEFHCHFSECHCDACQRGFREFLKMRYDRVEVLNDTWGTSFWSQTYHDFDEILTPRPQHPTYMNPSQQLDYYAYLSWGVTQFQQDQVQILRTANPNWFLFHNGLFGNIDYRGRFTQDLDLLGYDIYPLFCKNAQERPHSQSFNLDRARSWSGNFIVPEQQSGPGGQGAYFHDHPEPGEVRRMTYTSVARGADSLLYFRWRTCRFGAEEYWCGILDHDNVPRRRYEEITVIGKELHSIGQEVLGTHVRVDVAVATADYANIGAHRTISMDLPAPDRVAEQVHEKFFTQGYAVGCVHPADDLSDLKLYFIPHWVIIDPAWLPNLQKFVEEGGTLVVGARTGTRDRKNHVIAETSPGVLRNLCGMTVEEYGRQNDAAHRPLKAVIKSNEVITDRWYEMLKPDTANVVGTWKNRHLNGKPAVTCNEVGKGRVYYVGAYFTSSILDCLLPSLIQHSGLRPLWPDAPAGLSVVVRQDDKKRLWFLMNMTDHELTLSSTPKGTELLSDTMAQGGSVRLEPNDVMVIKERKSKK